jgi:VIT1/CCC1 family predicted Fe2+/Mn2+ transporter
LQGEKHVSWGKSIRDIIFGMNDGLVSTLSFIAGFYGAVTNNKIILIGAIAEACAGSISMFAGAYLSIKSQREYFEAEIERERQEVEVDPKQERAEVTAIYRQKGFKGDELKMVVGHLTADKDRWVRCMMEEELRLFPEKFDKPLTIASIIGIAFVCGALVPILPFVFLEKSPAMMVALAVSILTLFGVGVWKAIVLTGKSWFKSGAEIAVIGMAACTACYFIGKLFYFLYAS